MIIGIGVDIVEKERIARVLTNHPDRFPNRILTSEEGKKFHNLKNHESRVDFLAKRFSAKEAVSKASGFGIGGMIGWQNIEITSSPRGQPQVQPNRHIAFALLHSRPELGNRPLIEGIMELADHLTIHLSISDEKHYATAQSVIELRAFSAINAG
jgi:holo-[acyl-carrier protein] synthase